MRLKSGFEALLLVLSAVVLSLSVVVLAPAPLMLLRRDKGRLAFITGAVAGSVALFYTAPPLVLFFYLSSCVAAGIFCECENLGVGYTSSMFTSTLVICGLWAIGVGYLMNTVHLNPVAFAKGELDHIVAQLVLPAGVTIDKQSLLEQLPSGILIALIFSLWLCTILVSRLESLFGWMSTQSHTYSTTELRRWKLPDSFVWIALASVAGTYFKVQPGFIKIVASNVLNVAILLYFFQGLAVVVSFFVAKQVSAVWRVFAYFLIFSQLFLVVSFIGFVDLWLEFREKSEPGKSAVA